MYSSSSHSTIAYYERPSSSPSPCPTRTPTPDSFYCPASADDHQSPTTASPFADPHPRSPYGHSSSVSPSRLPGLPPGAAPPSPARPSSFRSGVPTPPSPHQSHSYSWFSLTPPLRPFVPAHSSGLFSGSIPGTSAHLSSWRLDSYATSSDAGEFEKARSRRAARPSTRLVVRVEKLENPARTKARRWNRGIVCLGLVAGLALAGYICYDGYSSISTLGNICLVLDDDFSSGLSTSNWAHDVQLGGYTTNSFEWTTSSSTNSFVEDGVLYIMPTLTADDIGEREVVDGHTVDLGDECTGQGEEECEARSDVGRNEIIPPIQSARLTTRSSRSIKYGKIEVRARMPKGDWLRPGIFMLPTDETYGAWPVSGSIDIAMSRGNNLTYAGHGSDYTDSQLHWGPLPDNPALDRQARTSGSYQERRKIYSDTFHVFGLEWDEKFLRTYVDSRITSLFEMKFGKESFWERGEFPNLYSNGTDSITLSDPWAEGEERLAPFDQQFYLVLSVAAGNMNGVFPDDVGNKPWSDTVDRQDAMNEFWNAKDRWYPTWGAEGDKARTMAVDRVRIWERC